MVMHMLLLLRQKAQGQSMLREKFKYDIVE
jgi:hypothetical protein